VLLERAYKAAWLNNKILASLFNHTSDPHIGTVYPINANLMIVPFGQGGALKSPAYILDKVLPFNGAFTLGNRTFDTSEIEILCRGFGGGDKTNISNIAVSCGLVM